MMSGAEIIEEIRTRRNIAWLLGIITTILIFIGLHLTASITMPLACSIFLICLAWPIHKRLERVMPRALASLGTFLVVAAIIAIIVAIFAYAVGAVRAGLAEQSEQIGETIEAVRRWMVLAGLPLPDRAEEETMQMSSILAFVRTLLEGVYTSLGLLGLILIFMVLGMLEMPVLERKAERWATSRAGRKLLVASRRMAWKIRRYMLLRAFVSVVTGFLTWLFATLIGLDLALVWGLTAFLLNFIPFVGSILAIVPPTLYGLVQFQSLEMMLIILGGNAAIQITIGNYIEPRLEGRALAMSPTLVLFSIFFWGLIWGVPGAFLGVPLTIAMLTVCEQFYRTRWISGILGHEPLGNAARSLPLLKEAQAVSPRSRAENGVR